MIGKWLARRDAMLRREIELKADREKMELEREHHDRIAALDKRVAAVESRLETDIDMYIRRLNAASRKYLKAEQEQAMRLLPGAEGAPGDPRQIEAFEDEDVVPMIGGKQAIRERVKARKANP